MVNTYMREGLGTSVKMTENNEVVVIVRVLLSFLHFLSVGSVILHDECEIFIHQPPKMFNKIHFMLKVNLSFPKNIFVIHFETKKYLF